MAMKRATGRTVRKKATKKKAAKKKTAARKTAARKTAVRKTAARKTAARKTASRKPAASRRDDSFVEFVVEQLGGLGGVRAKSMFGGHGVYAKDQFFACVDDGRLYFRVSDETRPRYEALGMRPFAPAPNMVMKSYYEVPLGVLENAVELMEWARQAIAATVQKAVARQEAAAKAALRRDMIKTGVGARRTGHPRPAKKSSR